MDGWTKAGRWPLDELAAGSYSGSHFKPTVLAFDADFGSN
jgi:hypothetical protein